MTKLIYLLGIALLALSSCISKDLSKGNDDDTPKEEYDPSFDYNIRIERHITVTAKSPNGSPSADVPFSIYLENPYGEEGKLLEDVLPVYSGSTNVSGVMDVKVNISNHVKTVYVVTPYVGYGQYMQECELGDVMNLTFQGGNGSDTRSVSAGVPNTRAVATEITRNGTIYNAANNVYIFYEKGFFSTGTKLLSGDDTVDPELITTHIDVSGIGQIADNLFPERETVDDEKYYSSDYCTDLVIGKPSLSAGEEYEGTQVWVTFLGDGGFSINNRNSKNSLCYYTYDTGNPPTDIAKLHKTLLFPNTNTRNPGSYLVGVKVQLMYWDGSKYTSRFPAGKSIGWIMVSGTNGENVGDLGSFRFSTPVLNDQVPNTPFNGPYTGGIARWSEEGQCNIVGMENRLHLDTDKNNDKDYNDILFMVESDPIIKPQDDVPPPPSEDPKGYGISGVLAFEDNWPDKGDYDFNDLVIDYTYTLIPETERATDIRKIELAFTPKALGAAYSSGFGIQLPIQRSNVAGVDGATLEDGTDALATIIVYDNTRSAFGNAGGFINTEASSGKVVSTSASVVIRLKETVSDAGNNLLSKFNPFIYVIDRSKEIHLTDMKPTSKVNMDLFGTGVDVTNGTSSSYRMADMFPWALDIPNETSGNVGWKYPLERISIMEAYPDYKTWSNVDGHNITWLDKVNPDCVYNN